MTDPTKITSVPLALLAIVEMYLVYLGMIAVHEVGHAIAGALVGYRWKDIVVGPLKLTRENTRLELKFSYQTAGSGHVLPFPRRDETRWACVIFVLGGPVATLISALVVTRIVWLGYDQGGVGWPWIAAGIVSWMQVVSGLIPRTKPRKNDAFLVFEALTGRGRWPEVKKYHAALVQRDTDKQRYDAEVERYQESLAVWEADKQRYDAEIERYEAVTALYIADRSQRPCEWDKQLVNAATKLSDGTQDEAVAVHTAFYHAADLGDANLADKYIMRAMALRHTMEPEHRAKILLDAVYCSAMFHCALYDITALLHEADAVPIQSSTEQLMIECMRLRADGALRLAAGDANAALLSARSASLKIDELKLLDESICDLSDRALIERLIERAEQLLARSS